MRNRESEIKYRPLKKAPKPKPINKTNNYRT